MNRRYIVPIVVCCASAVVFCATSGWDFWRMSEYEHDLAEAEETSLELEQTMEETSTRIRLKEQILDDLLAERQTLEQATEQFLALNSVADTMVYLHYLYPAADDREIACRNVLCFAEVVLVDTTDRQTAFLARLKAEFFRKFPNAAPLGEMH